MFVSDYDTPKPPSRAAFRLSVNEAAAEPERIWRYLEAAYQDHVAETCQHYHELPGLWNLIRQARAASEAGGDDRVVRAVLHSWVSQVFVLDWGCRWRDTDAVIDRLRAAVLAAPAAERNLFSDLKQEISYQGFWDINHAREDTRNWLSQTWLSLTDTTQEMATT